jgi:hypothetical protein
MRKTEIITAPSPQSGYYAGTIKNTGLSQRDTLEETMINLATALGVKDIHKALTARLSYIYEVQHPGFGSFQSASNTILELSRAVASKANS